MKRWNGEEKAGERVWVEPRPPPGPHTSVLCTLGSAGRLEHGTSLGLVRLSSSLCLREALPPYLRHRAVMMQITVSLMAHVYGVWGPNSAAHASRALAQCLAARR